MSETATAYRVDQIRAGRSVQALAIRDELKVPSGNNVIHRATTT